MFIELRKYDQNKKDDLPSRPGSLAVPNHMYKHDALGKSQPHLSTLVTQEKGQLTDDSEKLESGNYLAEPWLWLRRQERSARLTLL